MRAVVFAFDLTRIVAAGLLIVAALSDWSTWIIGGLVAFLLVGLALRLWPGWWVG